MNFFKKAWCRVYQKALYVGMAVMPWREPKKIEGKDSLLSVPKLLKEKGCGKVLLVCDKNAVERGAILPFVNQAQKDGLPVEIYDGVLPNPTIDQIEQGLKVYHKGCDCIVAFGGGSVMDCAKIIGARAVRPNKSVAKMKGLLKIRKKLPLFVAVPTTAGTGSEVTVAAVISNPQTHEKYPINDFCLIPHYAVLDASLTVALPPMLTATTGMDALTHAVEAYVGKSNTAKTKRQAEKAVQLIYGNLATAYSHGEDVTARQNMQYAAFLAGQAFTRAYVGYVHAMAHALGGFFGIPHGLANSVILPVMLRRYGKSAHKKLAKLCKFAGIDTTGKTVEQQANEFISSIEKLNAQMNIPSKFVGYQVTEEDISAMSKRADSEANPLYPVPLLMDEKDFAKLYHEVL